MWQRVRHIFRTLYASMLRIKTGNEVKVIVVGVDFSSHRLIEQAQHSRQVCVIAAIDDSPWNHRNRLLGVPIHYPVETAALAARHGAKDVVIFASARHLIDDDLRDDWRRQRLRLHEADDQLDPAELIARLTGA